MVAFIGTKLRKISHTIINFQIFFIPHPSFTTIPTPLSPSSSILPSSILPIPPSSLSSRPWLLPLPSPPSQRAVWLTSHSPLFSCAFASSAFLLPPSSLPKQPYMAVPSLRGRAFGSFSLPKQPSLTALLFHPFSSSHPPFSPLLPPSSLPASRPWLAFISSFQAAVHGCRHCTICFNYLLINNVPNAKSMQIPLHQLTIYISVNYLFLCKKYSRDAIEMHLISI